MQIIKLYKYKDSIGTVITPNKRSSSDLIHGYRLIADEGKVLIKGNLKTECIDTNLIEDWSEIEDDTIQE